MRIGIVTGIWQRHEIFELFAKGVKDLFQLPYDFEVIVAGSEGEKSRNIVESHGFKYVEMPNQPLAVKMNRPVEIAGQLDCDYVLFMGSDDILHPEVLDIYKQGFKKKVDFIGVTDFYFYDTVSNRSAYWGGYREPRRKGTTCGAGRVLSKKILKEWNWKVFETKHNHILDNSMDEKFMYHDHKRMTFSLKDFGVMGLDIKSSTNMTPFKLWDNTEYIDNKIIFDKFPYVRNSVNN